jgi:4-amino-4-deoxy-L-arabinose transferase-like glycosyltransferase
MRSRAIDAMVAASAFGLALLVLSAGISRPFEKDAEPQSAEWIQNVVSDGNWLLPESYYGRLARKPPLFYWLGAGLTTLSGGRVDELRARVVSLVAGAALAVVVLLWTRAAMGAGVAWLAYFFLLGSYGFASRATLALTDMLMSLLVIAAYCVMFPLLDGDGSNRRAAVVGAILGLGVLAKGPVVIVLAAFGTAIYLLLTRQNPLAHLRWPWPWIILGVALALGLIWYFPAALQGGTLFWSVVFDENLGHFLPAAIGGTGEGRGRPLYHVMLRMFQGAFPISLLLPPVIAAAGTGEFPTASRRPLLYQASLVVAVATFFTFASVRRDDYILPAMPGFAILCASVFSLRSVQSAATRPFGHWLRNGAAVAIALVMVFGVAAALLLFRQPPAELVAVGLHSSDQLMLAIVARGAASLAPWFMVFALACVVSAVVVLVAMRMRAQLAIGAGVALFALSLSLLATTVIRPGLAHLRTLKPFVAAVRERIGDAPLYVVARRHHEVAFYYGVAVWPLIRPDGSLERPSRIVYVVAPANETERLPDDYRRRLRVVMESRAMGGSGPALLYELTPEQASQLKPAGEAAR